jgi:quercetin dioxygenase-like cupin family protein
MILTTTTLGLVALVSTLCVALTDARTLAAQDTGPAPLKWATAPSLLPPGALIALISGDPTKPGPSTIQLWMPDGYRMPPHSHPHDEHVEVKQGSLLIGVGDRFDAQKTIALAVGDSGTAPAGAHHYSVAKGATVVEVSFLGPYTITYLNPHDAPKQRSFPYGY